MKLRASKAQAAMLLAAAWLAVTGHFASPASADDAMGSLPPAISHRYVGVRKCGSCHKKKLLGHQVSTWQEGPHRRAFETLENQHSAALAEERGLELPPQRAPECLRCHVTAYALPEEYFAYALNSSDGVQCESCHGPGRDYRKKKVMSDPELAASKGLWDLGQGTAVCATCHNSESPTWNPERYTLADGSGAGFDFDQAARRIAHPIPESTKGRYLELEKKLKEQGLKVE